MAGDLLNIQNLVIAVNDAERPQKIVDGVNLTVGEQKIVALVGGSGSGKTTTGLSILGLLPMSLAVRQGEIMFRGENLLTASARRLQEIRGKEIAMVFQEPLNAFNPVFRIGDQLEEVLIIHTSLAVQQRKARALELLHTVGISDPVRVARSYPHQLSGGMRQRAMIAQAIAAGPKLLIADEPTSSLDVTLQAHIMELLKKLQAELKISILLITHDLCMVKHMADEVAVLFGGKVVEYGPAEAVVHHPQHAFTRQLMEAFRY